MNSGGPKIAGGAQQDRRQRRATMLALLLFFLALAAARRAPLAACCGRRLRRAAAAAAAGSGGGHSSSPSLRTIAPRWISSLRSMTSPFSAVYISLSRFSTVVAYSSLDWRAMRLGRSVRPMIVTP